MFPRCAMGQAGCILEHEHRHRHKYGRGPSRRICVRCGTRRRHDGANWNWKTPGGSWTHTNPVCLPMEHR